MTMLFELAQSGEPMEDSRFDRIYPSEIRKLAKEQFSPVEVCRAAATWLAEDAGAQVLDIGSGAGKFCMVGAVCTGRFFTGVEQQSPLHLAACDIQTRFALNNVAFLHGNVLDVDMRQFNSFYFFNAFHENLVSAPSGTEDMQQKRMLYRQHSDDLRQQLSELPAGTRLATYHSFLKEVPDSYRLRKVAFDAYLRLWEKVR
jgi:hypothetical protein